jgi:hypothetical protein
VRALMAVGLMLLVAAFGAPSASAAVARCHTSQLAASLRAGSPGAGQRYALLSLRNRSRRTCRVFGYAGLQLLDANRRKLPTTLVRDRAKAPRRVVLAPGHRTRALLHWTIVPGPGEPQTGACEPAPRWAQVTPPDERALLLIPWRLGPVCQHGRIDITPFGRTVL